MQEEDGSLTTFLPDDVDLNAAVELTTPVAAPIMPGVSDLVERARVHLNEGTGRDDGRVPLPAPARMAEAAVLMQLATYGEPQAGLPDRLYVLEFQGRQCQYVMFGHTKSLTKRLATHRLAAAPNGFALLQGWVSPGVANAHPLEQQVLMAASTLHGLEHFHERFYGMSFEKGLSIVRAVFELSTDWRSR